MSLDPENPKATEVEIEALVEYAAERGHNSQDLATLCALTIGCLIQQHGGRDGSKQQVCSTLEKVIRHHAGIERLH